MKSVKLIFAVAGAIATLSTGFGPAVAAFPDKPVTFYVGARAGGSADLIARILSEFMEKKLGQPVVVVNKPGGGGSVLATFMLNKKPDGYSVMMNASILYTFLPKFSKKMKFKYSDFSHISTITHPQLALVTRADTPWKDLPGMIAHFKKQNKAISLTSQIAIVRLMASAITKQSGIAFKIVPVKGGSAAGQQLLGGHVDLVWAGGWHLKYLRSGDFKVIASTSVKRLTYSPEMPTLNELGYKDVYMDFSFMMSGPKGMTKEASEAISSAVAVALGEPKVKKLLVGKFAFGIQHRGPAETEEYIRWEAAKYDRLLKSGGS